jgi:hypothetical protein
MKHMPLSSGDKLGNACSTYHWLPSTNPKNDADVIGPTI